MVIFHSYVKLPEVYIMMSDVCTHICIVWGFKQQELELQQREAHGLLPSLEAAIPSFFAGVQ
jgi:hypothetical protein